MTMLRSVTLVGALAVLAGCTTTKQDFSAAPVLTPVGTGVYNNVPIVQPLPVAPVETRSTNSLWSQRNSDYFRDTRALAVGDIVTVKIQIKDEAQLRNDSRRERESGINLGLDLEGSISGASLGTIGGKTGLSSGTESQGRGSIRRSERIDVAVAAVVTGVLPNGNLYIAGQQEIRVNYEVRVLSIAGIIRPGDILPSNTIPYERIAEARISYGGRGRLTEVQQPGWGQQVLDNALPY